MSQSFSFSFAGEDIEDIPNDLNPSISYPTTLHAAETGILLKPPSSTSTTAFPISGQTLIPAQSHSLESLLSILPSKISYGTLNVVLDDGKTLAIPRREWWDVRMQMMAEEGEARDVELGALGKEDVKTGVYEGGFKSWESSVDLVKVLAARIGGLGMTGNMRVLEMGCGTALPTLAMLQWRLADTTQLSSLGLAFADYNPSVLQLVTVPNILLTWAQSHSLFDPTSTWAPEGELDISPKLLQAFADDLTKRKISLSFYSGAWSTEFVNLVTGEARTLPRPLLVLAAETIYSPFALKSFSESLMAVLRAVEQDERMALVAAKKVYFGVGGSIEDFVEEITKRGGTVERLREESEGIRREVVEVRSR